MNLNPKYADFRFPESRILGLCHPCRVKRALSYFSEGRHYVEEFKGFAMRGNVLDGALGAIVIYLVADVLMSPIVIVTGDVDFANLFMTL